MEPCVYVARIPFRGGGTLCPARRQDAERCCNAELREQKISVWELLLRALRDNGFDPDRMTFTCENGKWGAENVQFSLSHCRGYVAVAVADLPVGVDVERTDRFTSALARILTAREREGLESSPRKQEFFAVAWTRKEAAFKRSGKFSVETQTDAFASYSLGDAVLSVTPPARVVPLGGVAAKPMNGE